MEEGKEREGGRGTAEEEERIKKQPQLAHTHITKKERKREKTYTTAVTTTTAWILSSENPHSRGRNIRQAILRVIQQWPNRLNTGLKR